MANYKRRDSDYVGVEGFQKVVPTGAIVRILGYPHGGTAGPQSLRDNGNGADYTVPTGKKFYGIGLMLIVKTTGTTQYDIHSGDTADSQTTRVVILDLVLNTGENYKFPLNFTIEAGKYVTGDPSGSTIQNAQLIGYEL